MKKVVLSNILLLLLALARPAWGAAAFVQSNLTNAAASTTSVAVTISAVGSGNLVSGCVGWTPNPTATLSSVTDDKSNTYTVVDNNGASDANGQWSTFYLKNITNGPVTITANFSGNATYRVIHVIEASGLDTSAPLDQHTMNFQTTPGTGTDAVTSGAVTTTANGEFVAACARKGSSGASGTYTVGTGYSNLITAGVVVSASESRVQTSAGSIAGTFTQSANNNDSTAIMTFKVPGGGSGSTCTGGLLMLGVGGC